MLSTISDDIFTCLWRYLCLIDIINVGRASKLLYKYIIKYSSQILEIRQQFIYDFANRRELDYIYGHTHYYYGKYNITYKSTSIDKEYNKYRITLTKKFLDAKLILVVISHGAPDIDRIYYLTYGIINAIHVISKKTYIYCMESGMGLTNAEKVARTKFNIMCNKQIMAFNKMFNVYDGTLDWRP